MKDTDFFNRDIIGVVKGIALILMFIHHFFTFPSWWVEGVSYPKLEVLAPYFCVPTKICVSIFCFITGYFYFFNKNQTYKYATRKISDLLISYWLVFLICAIPAAVWLSYPYSIKNIIMEAMALTYPTMIFCWYVEFYIAFMLVLPLIKKSLWRCLYIDVFLSFILIPIVCERILRYLSFPFDAPTCQLASWFPMVLWGSIFARYNLFSELSRIHREIVRNKGLDVALTVFVILLAPMGRWFAPNLTLKLITGYELAISMDILYVPVFIYAIVHFFRVVDSEVLNKIIGQVGKYSMLMWFFSCLFFGNSKAIFQPILYWPHNPFLVLLWGLLMCYGLSYLLQPVIRHLVLWKNNLLFQKKR